MAELGTITIDGLEVTNTNTDPTSIGVAKPIGSLVLFTDGTTTGFYQKTGSASIDWRKTSINPVGGYVSGRIPFGSSGDLIVTATTLFWDTANTRLGISTESPAGKIHAVQIINADPILVLQQPGVPTGSILSIRNSANTTVYRITADGLITFASGTAAAPAYSFFTEPDSGTYLSATGVVSTSTAGVQRLAVSATGTQSTVVFIAPAGAVGAPAYTFSGTTNTGFYSTGASIINASNNGVESFRIDASGVVTTVGRIHRFGSVNYIELNASAAAANRIYTLPDVGANANFIMSQSAQTIAGVKTFSSGIPISATTNQFVLGTTNTVTITSPAPVASRVYTIPDVLLAASFIMSEGIQTLNGAKTFSANPTFSDILPNRVLFAGTGGLISQSANLTWNNGTSRLSATNGTLFSTNGYILGSDISLLPVVGGQSVISSYWGLQLAGNIQSTIEYTPINVGANNIATVIIPNVQSASIGLLIRAEAAQSVNIFDIQDAGGTSWVNVSSAGLLVANNAMRLGTTANATNGNIRYNGLDVQFYRDTWRNLTFPKMQYDDFLWTTTATSNPFAWVSTVANGGTTAFNTTNFNTSVGTANISTGTSNNTTGVSALQSNNGTNNILLTGLPLTCEWRVSLPVVSTAAVNYRLRIGLQDSGAAGDPANGVYFTYSHGLNGGQWQGVTRNASTSTLVNSAVAVVAGTWYRLRAEVVITPSLAINFYIHNGDDFTFIGSSTTNITTNGLRLVSKINKQTTSTGTSSTAILDYVLISMER